MEKVVQSKQEFFIEFTDEELSNLNLKKGSKLTVEIDENTKEIKLTPFGSIEISLSDFNRDTLEFLISESVEKDISVNEVISDILTKKMDELDLNEKI